jgi:hypothetical protein
VRVGGDVPFHGVSVLDDLTMLQFQRRIFAEMQRQAKRVVMAELLARGIAWLIMAVVVLVAIAALIHDPVVAGALLGD